MVPSYGARRAGLLLRFSMHANPCGLQEPSTHPWCLLPPAFGNASRWKFPCLPPSSCIQTLFPLGRPQVQIFGEHPILSFPIWGGSGDGESRAPQFLWGSPPLGRLAIPRACLQAAHIPCWVLGVSLEVSPAEPGKQATSQSG